MPAKRNPGVEYLKEQIKEQENIAKMDKKLSKFGTKVSGGMVWTVGDMARYFEAQKHKRKH